MIENILLPEWAPSIHPMLVHFPIAIFLLAVLLDVASYFLPKTWWDEKKNLLLYGIATVSGVVTYFSGKSAADNVFLEAEAQSVLTEHADWAEVTLWFLLLYFAVRTGIYFWKKAEVMIIQVVLTLLSLIGVFLIFETAEYGGQMVFGHAVGVQQMSDAQPEEAEPQEEMESLYYETEKGWRWEIGNDPAGEFQKHFHWLHGSSEENNLLPETLGEQNKGLSFSGSELKGFFSSHQNYQSVQVDYYVDLSSFEGLVYFVNHVQDQDNYDFVSVHSNGTVKQGRLSDGKSEVFDEGMTKISAPLFIRVVSDDTHFRGYIDKTMIVHGHADAPQSGGIGLAFNGSGKLIVDRIALTKL